MRHNSGIPKKTVKTNWQRYIRTEFHKPFAKKRKQSTKALKAASKSKRPLHLLRPVVRCLSQKYDSRLRLGQGFTKLEVEKAGLDLNWCYRFGVKIDKRRKDQNEETLKRNVERLVVKSNSIRKELVKNGKENEWEKIKADYDKCE